MPDTSTLESSPSSASDARARRTPLDILIIAGHVRSLDWAETQWAPDLARALADRGHNIEVALDGCDDPAMFRDLPLLIHRPFRRHFGAEPFAFRAWARGLLEARPRSVALSLTPLFCGDVWLPLGPRASEIASRILSERQVVGAALELVHHPWLAHELLAERRAMKDAPRRRVQPLTIGPHAEGSSLRSLGYAARWQPIEEPERSRVRRELRARLGIPADDLVFLLGGTHAKGRPPVNLFQALAMLNRVATPSRAGEAANPPVSRRIRMIVTGRQSHTLHELAREAGCLDLVSFVGTRVNVAELFAASDVAIVAFGEAGLGTGRFACEAIRAGLPLIAAANTPGSDLVDSGTHKPGDMVREQTQESWLATMGRALDPHWLEQVRDSARRMSPDLTLGRLVERLESYLLGALR